MAGDLALIGPGPPLSFAAFEVVLQRTFRISG